MPALLTIYNEALSLVGSTRISDPQGASREAELCDQFYPSCRDEVLIEYDWSCATREDDLALTDTDRGGFAFAYQLPVDPPILIIRSVVGASGGEIPYSAWRKEKGLILSNEEMIRVRYTYAVNNPLDFDIHVWKAIAYNMASKLSFPLTQSLQLESMRIQQYAAFLLNAKMIEGQARVSEEKPPKLWSEAN